MDESGGFPQWVMWAIGIVVSTLAGVVGFLYKVTQTQNSREITGLDRRLAALQKRCDSLEAKGDVQDKAIQECEVDRARLSVKVDTLERHIQSLKAKYERQGDA